MAFSFQEILVETPDNPSPAGAVAGFLTTSDGVKIRYAHWQAATQVKRGTVLLLQGRSEYIEKYFETIEYLRHQGFAVLTFDWRGQGGSQRLLRDERKGHVEHFDHYLLDLEMVMNEVALPDCAAPFYILSHSMGGLISLLAAPSLANRVSRMVLVSPLLKVENLPMKQKTVGWLAGGARFLGLGWACFPNQNKTPEFDNNKLTSSKPRYQRNKNVLLTKPELALGPPTISWIFAAIQAMAQVGAAGYCNQIKIPTLIISGTADTVVSHSCNEAFGKAMRMGSCLSIDGAKHELFQEQDVYRELALSAFDRFIP